MGQCNWGPEMVTKPRVWKTNILWLTEGEGNVADTGKMSKGPRVGEVIKRDWGSHWALTDLKNVVNQNKGNWDMDHEKLNALPSTICYANAVLISDIQNFKLWREVLRGDISFRIINFLLIPIHCHFASMAPSVFC